MKSQQFETKYLLFTRFFHLIKSCPTTFCSCSFLSIRLLRKEEDIHPTTLKHLQRHTLTRTEIYTDTHSHTHTDTRAQIELQATNISYDLILPFLSRRLRQLQKNWNKKGLNYIWKKLDLHSKTKQRKTPFKLALHTKILSANISFDSSLEEGFPFLLKKLHNDFNISSLYGNIDKQLTIKVTEELEIRNNHRTEFFTFFFILSDNDT